MLLTLNPLSMVDNTIVIKEVASSVRLARLDLALVAVAIRPPEDSKSFNLVLFKVSFVSLTVGPLYRALALLLVKSPQADVLRPVILLELSLTMPLIMEPFTFIVISILPITNALASLLSLDEGAFVLRA